MMIADETAVGILWGTLGESRFVRDGWRGSWSHRPASVSILHW